MEKILIAYFVAISLASCVLTIIDKISAAKKKRRISEKTLVFLAVLGGSVAMYITMKLVRHKTRKSKFMIGLPFIFMLQVTVLFFLYRFVIEGSNFFGDIY